jgi:Protein of unknown function (DUF3160)/FlgD Ig-like domain
MKSIKYISIFLLSFYCLSSLTFAQSGNFNLEQYNNFLQSHQNMSTEALLQMYPAGGFTNNNNANYQSALYFDSINIKYNLTDFEKSLIKDHGFMVTERLATPSIGQTLLDIHHNDLPVFVSTDAILYAFHVSYDRILRDVELNVLIDKVSNLISVLRSQMPELTSKYASYPEMQQMLHDVDVYLTVPAILIGQNASPYFQENSAKVSEVVDSIMAANGPSPDTLFSTNCVVYDWSQFKPRGHYDSDLFPQLKKYFRTMMWFGRIELYLLKPNAMPLPPCGEQSFTDIQRQTIDSYLIQELFDMSDSWDAYNEIEGVLKFFVGNQDNVTLDNLTYLKNSVQIDSASQFLDSLKLVEFQDSLSNQSFAYQLILSQILMNNPMSTDSITPASAFLVFGQRYVDDSYAMASVVYDRINYFGERVCRLFPSALDPMFALGNDAAAQLLQPELNQYHYSTNLAALRYLFDSFDPQYWESSLYKFWLNAIRKLNPPQDRSNFPAFMKTAAFWQEKLNTQLSSWSELRHDNLLYAKQSYTGFPLCSFPYSYVEPFPEFYSVLKDVGYNAYNYFQSFNFSDPIIKQHVLDFFTHLQGVADTLGNISQKELDNVQLTGSETTYLQNMLFQMSTYTEDSIYNGWYPELFYRDFEFGNKGFMESNLIVADVHTTPGDCNGSMMGWVKHVGTGKFDVGVFIARIPGGENCAFIGPVLSYHEYTTTNFLRLTDDEWKSDYYYLSTRPDWVNLYLADSTGNSRGSGSTLLSVDNTNHPEKIPVSNLIVRNYPNPFNPSTIISFTIPTDLTNDKAELIIYNIQGEEVKHLIDRELAAGNYLVKWFGKNDSGIPVASGIYIYRLRVAGKQAVGKMNLVR